jgi:hypothetical protein
MKSAPEAPADAAGDEQAEEEEQRPWEDGAVEKVFHRIKEGVPIGKKPKGKGRPAVIAILSAAGND